MIVKIAHYNFFLLLFLYLFLISCDDLLNYSDLEYTNDSELNSEKGLVTLHFGPVLFAQKMTIFPPASAVFIFSS